MEHAHKQMWDKLCREGRGVGTIPGVKVNRPRSDSLADYGLDEAFGPIAMFQTPLV